MYRYRSGEQSEAVRFDDMISTILAQTSLAGSGRSSAFRQLVDLLAQGRGGDDVALLDHAYAVLDQLRREVTPDVRARAARQLMGYRPPIRLIRVFAGEAPRDVAPLFSTIALTEAEWRELIPALSPPLRMLVRERRDLPEAVRRDVDAFGPADMVLSAPSDIIEQEWAATEPGQAEEAVVERVGRLFNEAPVAGAVETEAPGDPMLDAGQEQIRDLLARIEAFRASGAVAGRAAAAAAASAPAGTDNEAPPPEPEPEPEPDAAPAPVDFRWESDAIGQIVWVEGVERAAFIGRTIAVPAVELDDGVDAGAASAFQQRAPFRDARLAIPGAAPFSGEWRLSGVPFFDPRDGRFTGFRGTARRPRPDEVRHITSVAPAAVAPEPRSQPLSADGIRQMVHELRTPLNAIMGFAEMIERQMLGPAAQGYRERAGDILAEAQRLLGAVEDLDVAARSGRAEARLADFAAVVDTVVERYRPLARNRGVTIDAEIGRDIPAIAATVEAMDRLVGRLLASVLAMARAGERLSLGLEANGEHDVRLVLLRPAVLVGRSEAELLDPELRIDDLGKEAPALGLSFGLRLVRQLVQSLGGTLRFDEASFVLDLPAARQLAERRDDAL
jgi:signal transduction histidine kinase